MRQAWVREDKVAGLLQKGYRYVSAFDGSSRTWRFAALGVLNVREYLMAASDIVYARANVDDDGEGPYWHEYDSAAWTGRRDEWVHFLLRREPHKLGPGRKEYEAIGWIS